MMYLVLLVLSDILLALNQVAIFVSSVLALLMRVVRSESESSPVVSSAYSMVSSSVELGKSFMKQENSVGPSVAKPIPVSRNFPKTCSDIVYAEIRF